MRSKNEPFLFFWIKNAINGIFAPFFQRMLQKLSFLSPELDFEKITMVTKDMGHAMDKNVPQLFF